MQSFSAHPCLNRNRRVLRNADGHVERGRTLSRQDPTENTVVDVEDPSQSSLIEPKLFHARAKPLSRIVASCHDDTVADWQPVVNTQQKTDIDPTVAKWQDAHVEKPSANQEAKQKAKLAALERAARLREAMADIDVNQAELARMSDLSKSVITRFLKGEATNQRAETIEKLAKPLGVEPAWLQSGTAPKRPPVKRRPTVDEVLEGFEWPKGLKSAQVMIVVERLESELMAHPRLPISWLRKVRLMELIDELRVNK